MNRTLGFLAGFLLSVTSVGAQAQATGVQLNMDSGFYLGAGVGNARSGDRCVGICEGKDWTWNVYAGYQFNRHLAVEGGYSHLGEHTTSTTLTTGGTVTAQLKSKAFELVGVGFLPLTDNFSLYAKLGLYRYDTDATASGLLVGTSSETGTEFTGGLGMQYTFARNLAARLEWQRYADVGTGVIGLEKDGISVWRLGARYKF